MVFLCGRPGCGRESAATLQIDAVAAMVTLVDPRMSRDGVALCAHHADITTPPMGWSMNDLRGNRSLTSVPVIGPKTGDRVGEPPPADRKASSRSARDRAGTAGPPASREARRRAVAPSNDTLGSRTQQTPIARPSAPTSTRSVGSPSQKAPGADEHGSPADTGALRFPVSRHLDSMAVSSGRLSAVAPESSPDNPVDSPAAPGDRPRHRLTAASPVPERAPSSRPARRRAVSEQVEDQEDKFPWHFHFKDDEPQELQAKSPLLARAFRYSVG